MSPLATLIPMFQARYPEFNAAGLAQVQAAIQDCMIQTDNGTSANGPVWPAGWDDLAVLKLAAHTIAMSPGGNPMRIKAADGTVTTTYKQEYDRMVAQVAGAARPILGIATDPNYPWNWGP